MAKEEGSGMSEDIRSHVTFLCPSILNECDIFACRVQFTSLAWPDDEKNDSFFLPISLRKRNTLMGDEHHTPLTVLTRIDGRFTVQVLKFPESRELCPTVTYRLLPAINT